MSDLLLDLNSSLGRMKSVLTGQYGLDNLNEWITKNTMLKGQNFNFKDHEFQLDILKDPAKVTICIKCAQIGLSETMYRWAVAACCVMDDFTVIYTFPSSTDAESNNRTRIDPMINSSPELLLKVNPNLNNSSQKQFGRNSFLFFKGTRSELQGISTPADAVIHDEYDKSNITNASVYASRLQHSAYRIHKFFSTPTVDKYGVSKEAETANRMRHLATCKCCNHVFAPDYYADIVVPGWDKGLDEITKTNIHTTRWAEAYLKCPKCGRDPELHTSRLNYVCENQDEKHVANAWYVTPFSAPNILTPAYLVEQSTKFKKVSEFKNQTLGLTAEDVNESITLSDMQKMQANVILPSSDYNMMGGDLGIICRVVIGRMAPDGSLIAVHREKIHFTQFEQRTAELAAQYSVIISLFDYQPYTDMIMRMTRTRMNTWGAQFVSSKTPVAYRLQDEEEIEEEGKLNMKLVKINRTVALDELLALIKEGRLIVSASAENDDYTAELMSLKRVQKFTQDGELTYVWEKTDGEDHYHFATMYMHIAVQLRGMVQAGGLLTSTSSLLHRVRMR